MCAAAAASWLTDMGMMRLILLLLAYLAAMPALAQLVVNDPAAMVKHIESVNNGLQMIKNMEQQIATAEKNVANLEGNLQRAKDLKLSLAKYKNILNDVQRSIPNVFASEFPAGRAPDMSNASDVHNALDHIYNPYMKGGDLSRNMQYLHKQTTARAALELSELSIAGAEQRFAELESLTAEIDGTSSLKDAADMANKLLLKILMALEELGNMQAQLTRMQAAQNYTGLPANTEFKLQEISEGEMARRAITNGQKMFKGNPCSGGMKEAGLCN